MLQAPPSEPGVTLALRRQHDCEHFLVFCAVHLHEVVIFSSCGRGECCVLHLEDKLEKRDGDIPLLVHTLMVH